METLKRYLIFLVGLFVNSLGVSLNTDLGEKFIENCIRSAMKLKNIESLIIFVVNDIDP